MRLRRIQTFFFSAAVLWCALHSAAGAQTNPAVLDREELFYTYAGFSTAGGMSMFHRDGWIDDRQKTKDSSGWYAGAGLLVDIYVRNVCGEFSWQYSFDQASDTAVSFSHSVYTASAKYIYTLDPRWDLTAGGGLYFEGQPAAKEHGGAGGELTFGTVFTAQKYELKFPVDARIRYGFWGQDAKSTRFGYGLFFGVTKKLGRS